MIAPWLQLMRAGPWCALVTTWLGQGVSGTAIRAALRRNHGFTGSYSSVARLANSIRGACLPDATMRLHFESGDAAPVDFGAGPMLRDADGIERRTWAFVMTLCFSRHQYVEFVWDQSVTTWLGCHRRAFEWFGGVPRRVIIDNARCAIAKAITPFTTTAHDALRETARLARKGGFVRDDQENEIGIVCFSAAVCERAGCPRRRRQRFGADVSTLSRRAILRWAAS